MREPVGDFLELLAGDGVSRLQPCCRGYLGLSVASRTGGVNFADDRGTPGGRGRRRRLCARLRRSHAHATGPNQKGELAEAEHKVTWILRERRGWWKRPRAELPGRFPRTPCLLSSWRHRYSVVRYQNLQP